MIDDLMIQYMRTPVLNFRETQFNKNKIITIFIMYKSYKINTNTIINLKTNKI